MRFASFAPILLLALCSATGLRAQQTYTSRVVDAGSNEPLPFARVYVGEGRGAITNYEGAFTIIAKADELLTISYVGYSSLQIRAGELPSIIRMKAVSTQMREVTVIPIEPLLVRASKKLYAEYLGELLARKTVFRS